MWMWFWGRVVGGLGLVLGELSHSLILDVSHVAVVVVGSVGDGLNTTIRQVDLVATLDSFAVSRLGCSEVSSRVLVGDTILVGVGFGGLVVGGRLTVGWGWGWSGG